MRRPNMAGLAMAAVLATTATTAGSAQTVIGINAGGGVALPVGDFGTLYKTGFSAGGGLFAYPGGGRLGLRAEGAYSRFHAKDEPSSVITFLSVMGNVVFRLNTTGSLEPYLLGGVGMLGELTLDSMERSRFAWQGGAGVFFGTGKARGFAEARYLGGSLDGATTAFIPVVVGLSFRFR